jgi:F0F1-type ATP synthase beta subunit
VQFTRDDWKKLNQRFVQTQLKKSSQEVQKIWNTASEGGARSGKVDKQHRVITAWIIDPTCGKAFLNMTKSLTMTEKMEAEEEWMARKQLSEFYDDSEIEEMLELGTLERKKNP